MRVNDASGEHTKELPVELSTSTLECVTNAINEEIAAREGSVWGRHHAKKDKADKDLTGALGERDRKAMKGEGGKMGEEAQLRAIERKMNEMKDGGSFADMERRAQRQERRNQRQGPHAHHLGRRI